jgi:hypothetical protein
MKMLATRKWMMASLALALVLGLFALAAPALASDGTFKVQAYHGINGNTLGLSKDLPVDITIKNGDGYVVAVIPNFTFKERIETNLPAGTYTIEVTSQEAGPLPSMTVGPVAIPEGVEVRLHARLLPSVQTPSIVVKVK